MSKILIYDKFQVIRKIQYAEKLAIQSASDGELQELEGFISSLPSQFNKINVVLFKVGYDV